MNLRIDDFYSDKPGIKGPYQEAFFFYLPEGKNSASVQKEEEEAFEKLFRRLRARASSIKEIKIVIDMSNYLDDSRPAKHIDSILLQALQYCINRDSGEKIMIFKKIKDGRKTHLAKLILAQFSPAKEPRSILSTQFPLQEALRNYRAFIRKIEKQTKESLSVFESLIGIWHS